MIQRGRNRKSQVASLISPVDGFRGSLQKKGVKPKNHIQDNAKLVKQTQQEFRMKAKADEEAKREKNTKLKQFQNVNSRVYNYSKRPQTCVGSRTVNESLAGSYQPNCSFEEDNKENINYTNISETPGKNNFIQKNIKKA